MRKEKVWVYGLIIILVLEYIWAVVNHLFGFGVNVFWGLLLIGLINILADELLPKLRTVYIAVNGVFLALVVIGSLVSWQVERHENRISLVTQSDYRNNLKRTTAIAENELDAVVNDRSSGDYYIYIGTAASPDSRKLSPVIKQLAKNYEVYYFDTGAYTLKKSFRDSLEVTNLPYVTYVHNGQRTTGLNGGKTTLHELQQLAKNQK